LTNYFSVFLILDLKAFERRLTEVIDKVQPTARLWRSKWILLILKEQSVTH